MIITCPHCGAEADTAATYCARCHRNIAPEVVIPREGVVTNPQPVRKTEWLAAGIVILVMVGGGAALYSQRKTSLIRSGTPGAQTACIANVKQVAIGALLYQGDWDEHNFLTNRYEPALMPYTKNSAVFACPVTGMDFGTNDKVLRMKMTSLRDASKTPYFFDTARGKISYPHGSTATVAFADAHAKAVASTKVLDFKP